MYYHFEDENDDVTYLTPETGLSKITLLRIYSYENFIFWPFYYNTP